jgi:biopolymer transport protein ExbD
MLFNPQLHSTGASALRTRYFPRSRVGHGLIILAPWINTVLLVALYWIVNSQMMLQPGVVVDLPASEFTEGISSGMIAVVLSVPTGSVRGHDEIVFFDDERFMVADPAQWQALKQAMAGRVKQHPDASLIIQADRRILHGTVVDLMSAAREIGVRRVDLAVKPLSQP